MICKILYNKYAKKVKVENIKVSKNKEFLIWEFNGDNVKSKCVGFTPVAVYYGGKTHLWFSILTGYFLPHSYTINLDNVKNKECYVTTDAKGVVRSIIPISSSKMESTPSPETTQIEEEIQPDEPEKGTDNEDLFR